MANNCLITKLKSVVNNDELMKLGEIVVYNEVTSNTTIRFDRSTPYGYTPLSIRTYADDGTLIRTISHTNGNITITPEEKKILIDQKYDLMVAQFNGTVNFDPNQILYSKGLYAFNMGSNLWFLENTFDVSKLSVLSDLQQLTIINNRNNIVGELTDIARLSKLQSINIRETGISGDLEDLASLAYLHEVNIAYCSNISVKRSTLNAFAARNITVIYTQTPIEDV